MDTTQLLYLAGAFLLGFFFAWFMGRSGPKRALEESEANANALKRKVDDGARATAKLEDQLKQQTAQVDSLGAEKSAIAAQIATYEQSAADSTAELAQLQQQLSDAQTALSEAEAERLRLEAELGHMRDAYADTRSRFVELTQQAEADRAAAEAALVEEELEAIEAEEIAEDVTTALALAEESYTAEVSELTGQVQSLETELAAARAALSRMSAQVALRPELTAGKRQEYAALAGNPDKVIAALHERDIAVVDARGEVDYLRRTIGMLTAMGAELANEVERRRREQQLLAYQVAGLTAEVRNVEMKQIADKQAEVPAADLAIKSEEDESLETRLAASSAVAAEMQKQLEDESAAAAELRIQLEERSKELEALKAETDPLQANLDELQSEIEALNAAKADLEAQIAARDTELTETKDKLVGVQTDADSTAAAKAGLEQQLQTQNGEWDALLARINALNDELAAISAGEPAEEAAAEEPAAETPAETPAEAPAAAAPAADASAAPSAEVAALAITGDAAEASVEITPEAARAADAAIPVDAGSASEQPAAEVTAEPAAEPAAEPTAEPAEEKKEESPATVALAKLSAGVAAAVALLKRKNAKLADYEQQVGALSGDKSTLESTVAAKDQALVSTQSKVEELQSAMTQRSARFDALSMHASGLEAELEIQRMDRSKLDDQVRQVATDLQGLTTTYGAVEAAPAEAPAEVVSADAAAPAEAAAEAVAETPAAAPTEAPAEAAPAAEAPAAPVEVTSIEALTASAAAVAELVRSKQGALDEAKAQLASLQEELASYTAAKEALAAELESKGLSLSDVQAQLQAVQGDYAGEQSARGELETKLQDLDGQLQGYLAEYGDVEEPAAPAQAGTAAAAEVTGEAAAAAPAGAVASADVAAPAAESEAAPEPAKADAAARLAALGLVLKRHKESIEIANGRIGELEAQVTDLTAQKADLEAQVNELLAQKAGLEGEIQQKEQALADLNTQYEASQADAAQLKTDIETLKNQLDAVQAELKATEEERQRLDGQLDELNTDLTSLAAAWDAGDEATVSSLADKLMSAAAPAGVAEAAEGAEGVEGAAEGEAADGHTNGEATREMAVPLAKTAGAVAVAGAIRKKQQAMEETTAQLDSAQQEQAALTTAKADLEAQLAALQAKYDETEAARTQLQGQVDELTAEQEAAKALLAERDSAVQEAESKLEAITLPVEKTLSDFKAAARAAAEARGVEVSETKDVQDLAELKHIGVTFEQRLYRAGAGTYWEVAHMTDDDFELVLRLTEMQKLAMDMNEVRTDAVRLAEESNSVGLLSAGETPDDFEPIQGIGKIFEQRLYSAGIRTYRELSNTSEERLAEICQARKPLVPDYGSWIRQARMFMEIRGDK